MFEKWFGGLVEGIAEALCFFHCQVRSKVQDSTCVIRYVRKSVSEFGLPAGTLGMTNQVES